MFYQGPKDVIIQIETTLLAQLIYYWDYYEKPSKITLQKAKADNLTGVRMEVNDADAGSFLYILIERLKVKLYDNDFHAINVSEVF